MVGDKGPDGENEIWHFKQLCEKGDKCCSDLNYVNLARFIVTEFQ